MTSNAGPTRVVAGLRRDAPAWAAVAAAVLSFTACLGSLLAGGWQADLPWAPTLGLRLSFSFDGLAALYGLVATGIGVAVFVYGARYIPLHLAHEDRPASEQWRFWPWMTLFMVSMVGLALAQDLILLFVFFDLTAVCSYFLIGFDHHRRKSRNAALMALVVTGVSAVAMLVAAVLFHAQYGTFSIPELAARVDGGARATIAALLLAVAALAKSAQVPLHFWLPRAMAAPTPVSAYLHSAAMVAAGVLVIGRVHPVLARSEFVLDVLLVVGLVSIAVGGVLALAKDEFKQVLAHSTISQYGYMVTLYGIGGATGCGAAAFYVLAHAIAKSALFMTAGTVTEATGEDRLTRVGGLGRDMPVLAVAAGVAAATLAALPLTIGFFKDELFFAAALGHSRAVGALSVLAAALTFAYIGRFWAGLFLGPRKAEAHPVPRLLVAPVALLALVALVGGVVVGPFARLAGNAAAVTAASPVTLVPAYHLDAQPVNLMALASWALGGLLLVVPRLWTPVARALAVAGDRVGPLRMYAEAGVLLTRVSDAVHRLEVRDLRNSIAAVLVPGGVLAALGFAFTPTIGAYDAGRITGEDLLVLPLLVLVTLAALAVAGARVHLRMVLALSVVGFGLATIYALVGAPSVALVAVVVETVVTLVFLAVLARLPSGVDTDRIAPVRNLRTRRLRDRLVGMIAGLAAFAMVWGFLSRPSATSGVIDEQIRLTPEAHGKNVVSVILADFRGLDTLAEITVVVIAVVGVATLLRRGRLW